MYTVLEVVCDYKIITQIALYLGFLIDIIQEPNDIIALPGKDYLLQCVFVDDRSLLVSAQFFRNGKPTKGLQRHVEFHNPGTTTTIGLQIVNITREDDGAVYHCSPVDRPDITSRLVTIKVAGTVCISYIPAWVWYPCYYTKLRMSVNNKDIIRMSWLLSYKACGFFHSGMWLIVKPY